MRRGARIQKSKKVEVHSDVNEDVNDSLNAENNESESGSEVETTRKRRKDKSIDAEIDNESDKPVNKKKKGKADKESDVDAEVDDESDKPVIKKKKGKANKESDNSQNGKAAPKSKKKAVKKKEESEEEEEEYEVEKIVDQRTIKGRRQFLIRWKGYTAESDTWEHEKELNCSRLIEEFLAEQEDNEHQEEETSAEIEKKTNKNKKSNKKSSKGRKDLNGEEEDDDSDDSKEYEVEKIIDVHFKKDKSRVFLIRWKGFSSKVDSWEPEEHLNCPELIDDFMQKLEKLKNLESRELRVNRPPTNRYVLTMYSDKRQSRRNMNRERKRYHECD